ncbi:MFS transporter [Xanthobacter sediminis]
MSVDVHDGSRVSGELSTIGAVGVAHFTSHMLQLALAPLFLFMRDDLQTSFVELGLILSIYFLCSGVGQVLAGVLVDRFGADRLLFGGMLLQGGATLAMGFAPRYEALLPLAALAGLGNSVYHPADLSILTHKVAAARLGRAFATHVICGNIGFALSQITSGGLGLAFGWRAALIIMGAGALVVALGLLLTLRPALHVERHAPAGPGRAHAPAPSFREVLAMPVVIIAFVYFMLTSVALAGVQGFSVVTLQEGFGASVMLAALSVTLYQLGNAAGVAIGGHVADRAAHHHRIAMGGLGAAAVLGFAMALLHVPPEATAALLAAMGFCVGLTMPSRDVLVRRATPDGATGKVFGVVYSGYDIGGLVGPLVYGRLLDHHEPRLVYVVAATALALCMVTAFGVRKRPS